MFFSFGVFVCVFFFLFYTVSQKLDESYQSQNYLPHCHPRPPPPPPQTSLSVGASLEGATRACLSSLRNSLTGGDKSPCGLLPLAMPPPCALACAAATPASARGTESTRARVTLENEARGGRSEAAA